MFLLFKNQDHLALAFYWITPQHVTVDVLALSDGLSAFSSVCNPNRLRTGECMSLKGTCSQSAYYATAWSKTLSKGPLLLYIEPPEINEVLEHERRSVAFLS